MCRSYQLAELMLSAKEVKTFSERAGCLSSGVSRPAARAAPLRSGRGRASRGERERERERGAVSDLTSERRQRPSGQQSVTQRVTVTYQVRHAHTVLHYCHTAHSTHNTQSQSAQPQHNHITC